MKKTAITTLTQKGQATIPKNVRKYLGIKPHDKIEFIIDRGRVMVKPVSTLEANLGRVSPRNMPEHFSKVREGFEEQVALERIKKDSNI